MWGRPIFTVEQELGAANGSSIGFVSLINSLTSRQNSLVVKNALKADRQTARDTESSRSTVVIRSRYPNISFQPGVVDIW